MYEDDRYSGEGIGNDINTSGVYSGNNTTNNMNQEIGGANSGNNTVNQEAGGANSGNSTVNQEVGGANSGNNTVNQETDGANSGNSTVNQETGGANRESSFGSSNVNAGSTGNNYANHYADSNTNNYANSYGSNANNYGSNTNSYGSNANNYGSNAGNASAGSYANMNEYANAAGSSANDGTRYNTYQPGSTNAEPEKKEKKHQRMKSQGGGLRKVMTSVGLGLCFGLFAGIGFYAVEQATGLFQTTAVQENVLEQNGTASNTVADETQSGIKLTDTSSIRVVSSDVKDVAKEVMPAMVSIVNNYTESTTFFGQTYSQEAAASGSGIIVAESDTELLIVSNHHVVADATSLDVTFVDGSQAEAQIKGMDADMDLAVIAIPLDSLSEETKNAIAIATMGDSDSLEMGEPVIAIGNALGYGQSVTSGIVSALNREITLEDGSTGTFIQTDAAINPGNSGGALLNVNGEVVGINSNKIGGSTVEGMGYAIPISAAKPIIAELMLKETRTKVEDDQVGYIGIRLQTITTQFSQMYNMPEGIYVTAVEENSPAQEAGILNGDIIVNFDGETITSYEDLQGVLQYYAAGSTASITVKRPQNGEYKEIKLTITLGSKPAGN